MSEQYRSSERSGEHHVSAHEAKQHHERLKQHHEKAAEKAGNAASSEQEARHEVHEKAISAAEYNQPQSEQRQQQAPTTKADKLHSFNTTMHHVRQKMSKPEQAFSTFIHKPSVEKASDAMGKTVARPSGVAGATVAAFIGLLSVYGIAKIGGFELSGSEVPLLLVIGFVLGLFIEWAYKSIRSIARAGR